jgi:signal transduction histidine kinase
VLGILVDNAAKYTDDGGIVSVTTVRRKGDVLVRVSDTGHGIAPEDLPNIFDRFYRSDSSRSDRPGGFGLGLAIAKRIIESVGGLIDVESELGKGTTFTIRVPRGRD